MTTVTHTSEQGFAVHELRNTSVALRLIPELGAKVSSLIDLHTGREWMWAPPGGARLHRNRTGDAYPDGTVCGADECLPTVASCRWRGRDLPDHGEAWTEDWEAAIEADTVVTRLRLPISPLTIERRVTLDGNTVRFGYALTNRSDEPCEYVWAFHPLLTVEEGDRLDVPCTRVRSDLPFGGEASAWPHAVPEGGAVKLYTEELAEGYAAIRNADRGEALVFTFDLKELPAVGLWINRGGWGGYRHVAIEPTSGAPDALDAAVNDWRRFAVVPAGRTNHWGFSVACE